jgi:dephospho-CoA kinase
MTFCVGLTGGIGCGKSTVANLFAEYGAGIIDTDAISRKLTQSSGAAIAPIRTAFGDDYIMDDGSLNRAKMRRLIFSDANAKRQLESILHPLILEHANDQLLQLKTKSYIIVVVPLLPESHAFRQLIQRVLVVDCDEEAQVARVIERSQIGEEEVRDIIAHQTARAERLKIADDVIYNGADMEDLAKQVAVLHSRYSKLQSSI